MEAVAVASPRVRYESLIAARQSRGDPQWQATVATLHHADGVRRLNARCSVIENAMLLGAALSIFTVMVESEVMWTASAHEARVPMKAALTVLSLMLAAALVWRYVIVCRVHAVTGRLPPHAKFFHPSSGLLWSFLLELLICGFHVPSCVPDHASLRVDLDRHAPASQPWTVTLSHVDKLDALVLARIYLLGRFLRNSVGIQALARRAHVLPSFHRVDAASVWFTIKYLFQKHPMLFSWVALLLDWALTSTALNLLERGGVNDKLLTATDAAWLTIVTMTSVGYGEIAPTTLGGKLTIALGAIVGGTIIITCLLRVVLIDALHFSPQEKLVLDVVHFHQHMRQRKQLAAFLIQSVWKLHVVKRRKGSHKGKQERIRLYAAAEAFRLLRFTQPAAAAQTTAASGSKASEATFDGGHKTCAALLDTFQTDLTTQHERSLYRLQTTAHLLRNMAATSSE